MTDDLAKLQAAWDSLRREVCDAESLEDLCSLPPIAVRYRVAGMTATQILREFGAEAKVY